jgi:muramoyltetrapeptide carboxypeptidase
MLPPSLQPGDTIAIMAPSSKVDRAAIVKAQKKLEALGFKVRIHPQTFAEDMQSAGTPKQKAAALHKLFADPEVKAIFAARGGNSAGHVLELLDYDLIKRNPKIIMGYSDVTALLSAINAKTGLVTFHGPNFGTFARSDLTAKQIRQCFNLLAGTENDLPFAKARVLRGGNARGKLVGGNLSLLVSLIGTPYMPKMDGAILYVEDCCDEMSRLDRMFTQLRNAGVFDKISGLIVGQFTDVTDSGKTPFQRKLPQVIEEATQGKKFPVVINAPFGHGKDIPAYPFGAKAELNASGKKKPTLSPTKPAVS